MSEPTENQIEPLFRPSKRRKIFRRRLSPSQDPTDSQPDPRSSPSYQAPTSPTLPTVQNAQPPNIAPPPALDGEETGISMANILRRRNQAKTRRGGIEFSATKTQSQNTVNSTASFVDTNDEEKCVDPAVEAAARRFAPQTGHVTEVNDKHMMAYIDAKMAELRNGSASSPSSPFEFSASVSNQQDGRPSHGIPRERQPAGLGKLMEVDLGPDTTVRNIARTVEATKRLEKGEDVNGDGDEFPASRKGRLGRGRRRRNSEDIKRDKLVEEVLRESRLEIYNEPEPQHDHYEGEAADERIAEQFRREFLDAIQSRNMRKTAPAPPGSGRSGKGDDRPKGPKLGGSRSARAAMRAKEELAAKRK